MKSQEKAFVRVWLFENESLQLPKTSFVSRI